MKQRLNLIIASSFIAYVGYTQGITGPVGIPSAITAGCSVNAAHCWSVYNNPSTLVSSATGELSFCSYKPYWVEQLYYTALAFRCPVGRYAIGAGMIHTGFSAYSQSRLTGACGLPLSKKVSLGIQFNLYNNQMAEYGNTWAFTGGSGLQVEITPQTHLGIALHNPGLGKWQLASPELIPVVVTLGLIRQLSQTVSLEAEVYQQSAETAGFRSGVRWQAHPAVQLGIGIQSHPEVVAFGARMLFHQLHLEFATQIHALLGITPQAGIGYRFRS